DAESGTVATVLAAIPPAAGRSHGAERLLSRAKRVFSGICRLQLRGEVFPAGNPEFCVDVHEPALDRPDRDAELFRDLAVRPTRGGENGGLPFGRGEVGPGVDGLDRRRRCPFALVDEGPGPALARGPPPGLALPGPPRGR